VKIGVTGHQKREGIKWSWVKETIAAELSKIHNVTLALSSLAIGTDHIFAEVAISLNIPVLAVIPLENYERFFEGADLASYRRLLHRCEKMQLKWKGNPERAFFEAGKLVVDQCDLLFAVWDGEKPEGLGGTADIVQYAEQQGRPVCYIDPMEKTVRRS
jgi:hypothetical protein